MTRMNSQEGTMNHFNRVACSCLMLCTLPLLCQEPSENAASSQTEAPAQRVAAPSPSATVAELEHQGDMLRSQKDYLDALDYYRAAAQKSDSAILHNKIGVSLLLLKRETEARREFERSIRMDGKYPERSEEHTSELQSPDHLVCRLLLEKKKI